MNNYHSNNNIDQIVGFFKIGCVGIKKISKNYWKKLSYIIIRR